MKTFAQTALLVITFGGAFGLTLGTSLAASTASANTTVTSSSRLGPPKVAQTAVNQDPNTDPTESDPNLLLGGH
jgi:hypothetical protein